MSSLPESIIHSNTHSQILYQKIQKTETIDELTPAYILDVILQKLLWKKN
jgi:hypothetical protein